MKGSLTYRGSVVLADNLLSEQICLCLFFWLWWIKLSLFCKAMTRFQMLLKSLSPNRNLSPDVELLTTFSFKASTSGKKFYFGVKLPGRNNDKVEFLS